MTFDSLDAEVEGRETRVEELFVAAAGRFTVSSPDEFEVVVFLLWLLLLLLVLNPPLW